MRIGIGGGWRSAPTEGTPPEPITVGTFTGHPARGWRATGPNRLTGADGVERRGTVVSDGSGGFLVTVAQPYPEIDRHGHGQPDRHGGADGF